VNEFGLAVDRSLRPSPIVRNPADHEQSGSLPRGIAEPLFVDNPPQQAHENIGSRRAAKTEAGQGKAEAAEAGQRTGAADSGISKRKNQHVGAPGYEDIVVARHLELLMHAGLIEGGENAPINAPHHIFMVKDMTWEGHDFLAAIQNDGVWGKIKQAFPAKELATMPLSVLKTVGIGLLEQYVKAKLGL
jgi:Hypothetical protein (DUF2513)